MPKSFQWIKIDLIFLVSLSVNKFVISDSLNESAMHCVVLRVQGHNHLIGGQQEQVQQPHEQ